MSNKNEVIDMKKKFKMPSKIKAYKIEKELFKVSNGHICIGTNTNINEKVFIKIYEKELIQYKTNEVTLMNNEIFMMKLINHKNALKLYEIIESPSYIFLIMEYFNGSKLTDYINRKKKISEDDALNIYKQILSFLLYIHDMNIGHLNLNSSNILIDNCNNIKICEFKYCVFYSNNERTKINSLGETAFISPELHSKKSCNPELSDIWSSGVILYLLTVGELPFYHQNELDLQKLIMRAEFKLPSNMNKNMQEFFKKIFEEKDESRYNFHKIFSSDLFKQRKITKNSLVTGLNILSTKYPIDDRVMNICKTNFNLEPEDIKQKLFDNIFDPYTSLYKQIIHKFTNKRVSNNADLTSRKFTNYINNDKNYFDEKTQKNNIQNSLNKELDYKQENKRKEENITQNQEQTLIDLEELLREYNEYKENPEELRKRESKSVETSKKREELKEKENKENKENKETNNIIKKKSTKKIIKNYNKGPNNKSRNKSRKSGKRFSINIATPDKLKSLNLVKNRLSKHNPYDKKLNIVNLNKGRRLSSNVNMDAKLKASLEKFKMLQMNISRKGTKKVSKNYLNKGEIIEETKEEYTGRKSKRHISFKEGDKKSKISEDNENSFLDSNNSSKSISNNSSKNSLDIKLKNTDLNNKKGSIISKKSSIISKKSTKKMKGDRLSNKGDINEMDTMKKVQFEEKDTNSKRKVTIKKTKSLKKVNENEQLTTNNDNKNDGNIEKESTIKSNNKNDEQNENIENKNTNKSNNKSDEKTGNIEKKSTIKVIKNKEGSNSLSNKKLQNANDKTSSGPPAKIGIFKLSKEDFLKQIRGVKLKKMTPNKYPDPFEMKKKDETKKPGDDNPIEQTNAPVKNVNQMIEDKLNDIKRKVTAELKENKANSNKGKQNNNMDKNDLRLIRKQMEIKYNTIGAANPRKSDNSDNDKLKANNQTMALYTADDKNEIETPKFKKTEKDLKKNKEKKSLKEEEIKIKKKEDEEEDEERRRKEREEKRRRENEERKKKKEEEKRIKEEEDEKRRRKEQEERIQREIEEENRIKEIERKMREKKDKKRKEENEKKRKEEEEEKIRNAEQEKARKIFEEERRQLEEEHRKKIEAEEAVEAEEKRKKEEHEKKKKRREEKEKQKKEREEEDKIKEKEEKIRKEKEKERIKKEEEDKIKKWKEEKKKKKENEEKKRLDEEERIRKKEEEERQQRKEENERKRLEEQEENRKRLDEYEKKQKEEKDKKLKRANMKKQKEEEMRLRREKEAKDRRNKLLKRNSNERKIVKKKTKNESDSENESSEENEKKEVRNIKTEGNQTQKAPEKKRFNFHSNPFDLYKTIDSEEDNSPKVKQKRKSQEKKAKEQPKKKKSLGGPKINDFNKFRESDRNVSDSGSRESSVEEKDDKNKDEEKNKLNKSVQLRDHKNDLFSQYTNYFFDDGAINEGQIRNQKSKKIKENKTNDEDLNTKKGFYHYQYNPTKVEKSIVDKKFEVRMKNPGTPAFNQTMDNYNMINKMNDNNNKKKFKKQYSNDQRKLKTSSTLTEENYNTIDENDLFQPKVKKSRNRSKKNIADKKQNNTMVYNHKMVKSEIVGNDQNKSKNKVINNKNKDLKKEKSKKKSSKNEKPKNNIVQNLINDFDQTEQSSKINNHTMTTRDTKQFKKNDKSKNHKQSSKSKHKENYNKKNAKNNVDATNPLSRSVIIEKNNKNLKTSKTIDYEKKKNSTNDEKKSKNKNIKENLRKSKTKKDNNNISEFNLGNSGNASNTLIKIKKSSKNLVLKEEDLPLYKGEIDYTNTSVKNIQESIDNLMSRYKKKGYTCIKKEDTEFTFIKGPNTHHVELMRLGNGLLYFNVTK